MNHADVNDVGNRILSSENTMKSILAVLVGYLIFGASSVLLFLVAGIDPKRSPEVEFRIWSTLYGIFFALLGGYTAAAMAGRKELWHASSVAIILTLLATISLIAQPGGSSVWSQISALGFMVPAVILGGIVRLRQMKRKDAGQRTQQNSKSI